MARYKHLRNVIGPAVRKYRIAKELSQSDLAAECQRAGWDISRDIIASIEGRGRVVADYEAVLLASLLEVPLKALYPKEVSWKPSGVPFFPGGLAHGVEQKLGISFGASERSQSKAE